LKIQLEQGPFDFFFFSFRFLLNTLIFYRDSVAKFLYSKVFDWLVHQINKSLYKEGKVDTLIGLLDIYGFEIFRVNRFVLFL